MAAEGDYSNYVPGTYGDFAAAVEPSSKFTIRNDIYYYQADIVRSVRIASFLATQFLKPS
jgi:hypothetical protein